MGGAGASLRSLLLLPAYGRSYTSAKWEILETALRFAAPYFDLIAGTGAFSGC